jgi:hypothetical protein
MIADRGNEFKLKVLISLTILLSIHEEKWKETNYLILSNIQIVITATNVRVIKSRKMRWPLHVARMGERICVLQGFGGEI